jgi:hypothetical protein
LEWQFGLDIGGELIIARLESLNQIGIGPKTDIEMLVDRALPVQ